MERSVSFPDLEHFRRKSEAGPHSGTPTGGSRATDNYWDLVKLNYNKVVLENKCPEVARSELEIS